MTMREPSLWELQKQRNPGHSQWYIERFETMRAQGADLNGEARLIDAMVPRGASILDAGAGPGRVGGELARLGHHVVGVDIDADLVHQAQLDHPAGSWHVGDLSDLDSALPEGYRGSFDAVVCAGNVMTFLAPSSRRAVLAGFAEALAPGGRAAIGFGAGRGYDFEEFFADAEAAGLGRNLTLATWDLQPFEDGSTFLVSILKKPENPARELGERVSLLG